MPLINFEALELPEDVKNMTIEDMLKLPECFVSSGKNNLIITSKNGKYNIRFEFTKLMAPPNIDHQLSNIERIMRMKERGCSQRQMARELNVSEAYVSQVIRKTLLQKYSGAIVEEE